MSVAALLVLLLAVLCAALSAFADGALGATLRAPATPATPPAPPPPDAGERDRLHRALVVARILAHVTAGVGLAVGVDLAGRPRATDIVVALLGAYVIVGLTEAVARSLGSALGPAAVPPIRAPLHALRVLLLPFTRLADWIDAVLRRILPPTPPNEEERETSAEQFRQVVAADVPRDERALLNGVFSLGETEVQAIMVPRVDIVGIDHATPWSEVVDRVRSSEHARFPVYDETLDEITGILYAKDLLAAIIADEPPPAGWVSLVRPATFIPATKTIDDQLRDFKAGRTHIAIVIDEYGGTAGLVTIEDVLEEIVGEIRDEYDEEEPPIESEEHRRYWVSGRVSLDELSEALGHDFAHEQVSTVGGLIYELLGRVPRAGEELVLDGFRVVVERVRRRRVERVYFERSESMAPQEAE